MLSNRTKRLYTAAVAGVSLVATLGAGAAVANAATPDTSQTSTSQQTTRPHRPAFTGEQEKCLSDAGFTKPADGTKPAEPSQTQRDAFTVAAEKCGITLPAPPDGAGRRTADSPTTAR